MKAMLEDVKAHWRDHYRSNFNNYAVQDAYVPKLKIANKITDVYELNEFINSL